MPLPDGIVPLALVPGVRPICSSPEKLRPASRKPHTLSHIAWGGNPHDFSPTIQVNGQLSALFLIARPIWLPQGETMTSGLLMNQASFGAVDSIWEALPRPARYYREIYEQNQHRIYSICFLMTGNELEAVELTHNVFHRI